MKFSDISKAVGLDARKISYPTANEVDKADITQLLTWNRFLASATNFVEYKIIDHIVARLKEEKEKLDER